MSIDPVTEPNKPLAFVVNNSPETLAFAVDQLTRLGWRAIAHATGATALASPELRDVQLIVSDVSNPPLGGLGLWRTIRATGLRTPFAFLSPHASDMAAHFDSLPDAPVAYIDIPISLRRFVENFRALAPLRPQDGSRETAASDR